jgi:hypothetical protein
MVGGGDAITQRSLAGAETLSVLPLVFLLRFVLGTVSYAAGTPGGLFAPMRCANLRLAARAHATPRKSPPSRKHRKNEMLSAGPADAPEALDLPVGEIFTAALANCYIY